ncbi:uncharacterized protein METZ01_LOCUS87379 [marine metagenome]|uniref:Uncharacterized protein n=1 Tax=marine metagenome TaxID=408172 RepID=A0A381V2E6_9ZZZZ
MVQMVQRRYQPQHSPTRYCAARCVLLGQQSKQPTEAGPMKRVSPNNELQHISTQVKVKVAKELCKDSNTVGQ